MGYNLFYSYTLQAVCCCMVLGVRTLFISLPLFLTPKCHHLRPGLSYQSAFRHTPIAAARTLTMTSAIRRLGKITPAQTTFFLCDLQVR